jgi:hypothetical protein
MGQWRRIEQAADTSARAPIASIRPAGRIDAKGHIAVI